MLVSRGDDDPVPSGADGELIAGVRVTGMPPLGPSEGGDPLVEESPSGVSVAETAALTLGVDPNL